MEEKKEQKYVNWYQAKYVYAKHMNVPHMFQNMLLLTLFA